MIAQIFIPTAELVMPKGTQTNESNAEIETQPVTLWITVVVNVKKSKIY